MGDHEPLGPAPSLPARQKGRTRTLIKPLDPQAIRRETKRLFGSARWMYNQHGALFLGRETVDLATSYALYPLLAQRTAGAFTFAGREVPYVRHPYNRAWRNERSVELGLAADFLRSAKPGRILELGNVLAHYGPVSHDVVDKYESAPGVLNEDIIDFQPIDRYDLVLSISTIEHVGWDEQPREPDKVLRACKRLQELVLPGGAILVTAPLGYNPHLDDYLNEGALEFAYCGYLRRITRDNRWEETSLVQAQRATSDRRFRGPNAIFVGMQPSPRS